VLEEAPFHLGRVRTKLESPWMSLNLKTKIQGLECPWICKEVLECPWILLALVFGYFLKLFDIQDGHFVELILHVHIWPHYKVTFWTIQRHILLISNAFSSVFSPWICWYMALNVLEKSLNLTRNVRTLSGGLGQSAHLAPTRLYSFQSDPGCIPINPQLCYIWFLAMLRRN
jgi:hypothetical protein